MAKFKINANMMGVANEKALAVKHLCVGVGCILLSVGLYADMLGTRWAPIEKVKEELAKELSKNN